MSHRPAITIPADKELYQQQIKAMTWQIDAFAIWTTLAGANSETRREYGSDQMGVYLP